MTGYRNYIRTTNLLERAFLQVRRATRRQDDQNRENEEAVDMCDEALYECNTGCQDL